MSHLRDVRPAGLDPGHRLRAQRRAYADTRPEMSSHATGPDLVVDIWRDELWSVVDRTPDRLSDLAERTDG